MQTNDPTSNQVKAVGNTTLSHIRCLSPEEHPNIKIFAKQEKENPTGSVKDRIAEAMVLGVLENDTEKKITTIVEASSGNTASSVALYAKIHGFKARIYIPYITSCEKEELTKSLGAEVIRGKKGENYMQNACDFVEANSETAVLLNQYDNPLNAQSHYETLGKEIIEDMRGKPIHAFISVGSTGGTISGVGKKLKEHNPNTRVILADPYYSVLYDEYHKYKGNEGKAIWGEDNPCNGESAIEGVGKKIVPGNMDFSVIDQVEKFGDCEALEYYYHLQKHENMSVGGSSAANALIAKKIAEEYMDHSKDEEINIVTIFPDGGEKYKSKYENKEWLDQIKQEE